MLQPESSAPKVHLIRTTYRLIAQKGVHRVPLEEIAAAAAVSKGSVLYYFKTKENLVLSTMEWVLSEVATKALAREVARQGITVNCAAPGLTETPFLARLNERNQKLIAAIVRSIPLGRTGRPEEVARAILLLASPDAEYITGQTLSVNGGLTMA